MADMAGPASSRCVAVVVTHDSAGVLPDCLSSLAANGVPAIVVDNASRDSSREVAAAHGALTIANPRNQGYGRAMNIGVRAADGAEFCLVTNPDASLEAPCVAALVAAAERYPDAAMLAPRIVEPDGRLFFQSRSLLSPGHLNVRGDAMPPSGDACVPFLSGACFLVRREAFLAAGGFDDSIFLFYEDDDLCRRLREAGWSLVHVDGAAVRHIRGASAPAAPGRVFRTRWHQAWSLAYVSAKWRLPDPSWRVLLIAGLKWLAALLSFNRGRRERHAGSFAGALAWIRGRDALEREGLR
jgi:GT2 family glycosyltransferase